MASIVFLGFAVVFTCELSGIGDTCPMGAVDGRSWRDARFDMVFWLVGAAVLALLQVIWLATHQGDWTDLVGSSAPVVATLILADRRRRLMHRLRADVDEPKADAPPPI